MRSQSHVNRLQQELPDGLVVDGAWLADKGYSSSLRTYYARTGWLEQPCTGVYRRPGRPLRWEQVVISLQQLLKLPLFVGGRTALNLHGVRHYVAHDAHFVHLYGPEKPPHWLTKLGLPQKFVYHNSRKIFKTEPMTCDIGKVIYDLEAGPSRVEAGLQRGDLPSWRDQDWPLVLSDPERAYLELLDELPNRESFDFADKLMQSMPALSPRRLQKLLEDCTSVKVKRLFLFFADRHRHAWNRRLDRNRIDLGSGKRVLAKNGRLDPHYLITVPESLDAVE